MLAAIAHSDLLIADITYDRPNVYYELGFAHGLGRPVVLLARNGTELHFDIKDYNTIFYKNFKELHSKLSSRLDKLISPKTKDLTGQNNVSVCKNCKHFRNLEPDSPRAHVWYNHVCARSPKPKKIDPYDGKLKPWGKNDLGGKVFYSEEKEFQYCRDVNDGQCRKFEEIWQPHIYKP